MKVSVIVTTHNTERYLLKCMDSIFNQTLSDIELFMQMMHLQTVLLK